ncbi:MAG: hypothetical protein AAFX05_10910 [Planctomycetota bacterium]
MAQDAPMTWRDLGPLSWCAIGAAVLGIVIATTTILPLTSTLLGDHSVDVGETSAEQEQRLEKFNEQQAREIARLKGRSMFYVPPPPTEQEPEPEPEPEVVDTGPPPKPTRYAGPDVVAVVNGQIWFDNDRVLNVGDEGGGVRVVSAENAPWTVRVEWREVEFDVELFERTTEAFLAEPETSEDES